MMPDNAQRLDDPLTEISIEDLLPLLRSAVWKAYRKYHCHCTREDVDDSVHDVVVTLLKNDAHTLQSFEGRSSRKDWLRSVVNHRVLRSIHGRKSMASLDDLSPDDVAYQPSQEDEVWIEEMKKLLAEMDDDLTEHERQLLEFIRQGLRTREIAARMGIEPNSVSKSKRRLFDKVEERLQLKLGGSSRKQSDSGKSSKNEILEN